MQLLSVSTFNSNAQENLVGLSDAPSISSYQEFCIAAGIVGLGRLGLTLWHFENGLDRQTHTHSVLI